MLSIGVNLAFVQEVLAQLTWHHNKTLLGKISEIFLAFILTFSRITLNITRSTQ